MSEKNKRSQKDSKAVKVDFRGFFNPVLNQDIKSAVRALPMEGDQIISRHEDLIQEGFKVSAVSDRERTHYTISLFDRRDGSDSQGYVMSIKHSDFAVAITLCWVLVYEIYERTGWERWINGVNDVEW